MAGAIGFLNNASYIEDTKLLSRKRLYIYDQIIREEAVSKIMDGNCFIMLLRHRRTGSFYNENRATGHLMSHISTLCDIANFARKSLYILFFCVLLITPSQHLLAKTHTEIKKASHSKRLKIKNKISIQKLMTSYQKWKGTRYRYGGTNHRGIDCSSLTRHIFKDSFGIHLPRTTYRQIKLGQNVTASELSPGDLVFFVTGRYDRHVGIYIGNQQFMHASRIKGVTISKMKNVYWKNKFLAARRMNIPH